MQECIDEEDDLTDDCVSDVTALGRGGGGELHEEADSGISRTTDDSLRHDDSSNDTDSATSPSSSTQYVIPPRTDGLALGLRFELGLALSFFTNQHSTININLQRRWLTLVCGLVV